MIKEYHHGMHYLVATIIAQLESELATAAKASQEAHSSATHSENISTNRYDTLALEAAYLAHGQSLRIAELQESIALYKAFKAPNFTQQSAIQLGALIDIKNSENEVQRLFLGPSAGGLKIEDKPHVIHVLTPSTPLGKALLNKEIDDDIELQIMHKRQSFTIINIQ